MRTLGRNMAWLLKKVGAKPSSYEDSPGEGDS
jgi:hypothetical protein